MNSDNEKEGSDINRKDIKIKVERFCEQAQIYLNRLPALKTQLDDINQLHQFELYVQKLNEIGKIVQNLLQNIRTVEQLHEQLNDKDRTKLDRQVRLLRTEIDREMTEFQTLRQQAEASSMNDNSTSTNDTSPFLDDNHLHTDQEIISNELRQRHVTTTDYSDESFKSLEHDLKILQETIGEVAQLVAQQREKISHTERLIDMAHDRIHDASTLLQRAVHSKYATTISGALIGASLGGPVGFVMGAKIGTIAALSGSAVGALSGNLLRWRLTRREQTIENNSSYNQAML